MNPGPSAPPTLARWAGFVAAALAGAQLLLMVGLMLARVGHPAELEWMEGGMLDHVLRLRQGLPLYAEPSLGFIPFVYPPLWFVCAWGSGLLLGHGFLAARLVGVVATTVAFGLAFALARRESGSSLQAWLALGCLALVYPLSGFFFDLARVDALLLALLLGALACLRSVRIGAVVAAALLLVAACLVKQNALIFVGLAGISLALRSWRQGLLFAGLTAPALGLSFAWLQRGSGGWAGFYLLDVPASHGLEWGLLPVLGRDLAFDLPLLLLLCLPAAWLRLRAAGSPWLLLQRDPLLWFLAGAALFSVSGRLHFGGYDNVLIPLYALAGLTVCATPWRHRWVRGALPALVALQLGLGLYDPRPALPHPGDAEGLQQLEAALDRAGARVLMPYHGHYLQQSGRAPCFHVQGLLDLTKPNRRQRPRPELEDRLLGELARSLREGAWDGVVLDTVSLGVVESEIQRGYRPEPPFLPRPGVLLPPSGVPTRPETLWLPAD